MKISKVRDGAVTVITLITTDTEAVEVMRRLGNVRGHKPAVDAAKQLAQRLRSNGASLRSISATLAQAGYTGPRGTPYLPGSITAMLNDPA